MPIKDADQILVLNKGEIIERGNHDELLELNGYYADMYRIQTLQKELWNHCYQWFLFLSDYLIKRLTKNEIRDII